jgi:hypothetical protein
MQAAQNYISAIQDYYSSRLSAAGRVEQFVVVSRVVYQSFARESVGRNDPYHPVAVDDIAEAYADKFGLVLIIAAALIADVHFCLSYIQKRCPYEALRFRILAFSRHSIF